MRNLANGDKNNEEWTKLMAENFVFLNVYSASKEDETGPRGPEGPFRFQDKSVPVTVIKRWDGLTIVQQLGGYPDMDGSRQMAQGFIFDSTQMHGPIIPPALIQPLLTIYQKALAQAAAGKTAGAIKDLKKILVDGKDPKTFPKGTPFVVKDAEQRLKEIALKGEGEVTKAEQSAATDSKPDHRKVFTKLLEAYGEIPELRARIEKAESILLLKYELILPKESPTLESVNSSNVPLIIRITNGGPRDVTVFTGWECSVTDRTGAKVERSKNFKQTVRDPGCFLQAFPFKTLAAGTSIDLPFSLPDFVYEPRVMVGWKLPEAGDYTLTLKTTFDRASFKKRCKDYDCKGHDDAAKDWNRAIEVERTFTGKLTVKD